VEFYIISLIIKDQPDIHGSRLANAIEALSSGGPRVGKSSSVGKSLDVGDPSKKLTPPQQQSDRQ
jgi:hypothetical protein